MRNLPPKSTRFVKGVSGNPNGRPPGSKNLRTLMMEAARDPVVATIGGKPRKITKIQATTMQLATKAAGGDHAAIVRFLDWIDDIETYAETKPAEFPLSEADVEVIRAIYARMQLITSEDSKD